MDDERDKAVRMAREWCRQADIVKLAEDGVTVARIADKVSRPMQEVTSANGDPRELMFGYWCFAARAREDVRTLLKIGWGL